MNITFYGVRGSTPCAAPHLQRYGGNTACVSVEAPGLDPIVLDLGTGLRFFGLQQPQDGTFRGSALVSHLHWDHVQGLPFFTPALAPGARLDIYAPRQHDCSLCEAVDRFMQPPYFPVGINDLPGEFTFTEAERGVFEIGPARVRVADVPHLGPTVGYRIEVGGVSVAYVSDHQQPGIGSRHVEESVLELCDGVDVLIHDSQYTEEEFARKVDWGHCTVDYAVEVAAQAGARTLVLFHHDPSHDDEVVDSMCHQAMDRAERTNVEEVLAAAEGLTLSVDRVAEVPSASPVVRAVAAG